MVFKIEMRPPDRLDSAVTKVLVFLSSHVAVLSAHTKEKVKNSTTFLLWGLLSHGEHATRKKLIELQTGLGTRFQRGVAPAFGCGADLRSVWDGNHRMGCDVVG